MKTYEILSSIFGRPHLEAGIRWCEQAVSDFRQKMDQYDAFGISWLVLHLSISEGPEDFARKVREEDTETLQDRLRRVDVWSEIRKRLTRVYEPGENIQDLQRVEIARMYCAFHYGKKTVYLGKRPDNVSVIRGKEFRELAEHYHLHPDRPSIDDVPMPRWGELKEIINQ